MSENEAQGARMCWHCGTRQALESQILCEDCMESARQHLEPFMGVQVATVSKLRALEADNAALRERVRVLEAELAAASDKAWRYDQLSH